MNCCTSGDPVAEIGNNGDSAPWVTLDLFLGYGDIPGSGGGDGRLGRTVENIKVCKVSRETLAP